MHTIKKNKQWIFSSSILKDEINEQWFNHDYWMNQGRLLGANSGRGSTWVVKSEWGKWVLRHYFRGGFYAKINKDSYFWTGIENTRAYQEYTLLTQIQALGLPCPKPVAAMVVKKGLFYQNDLIMEHIHHDQTFAQAIIASEPLNSEVWYKIGHTIAQFHHNGIYHSDLNSHNILLSGSDVFVIDFDKGKIRTLNNKWQAENMNRLKRSIEKVSGQSCENELDKKWQSLLDGYHAN
ncbi:MAG: 3-deoxy-D-manno-octulosonic acid kinase [Marinicella sp.]